VSSIGSMQIRNMATLGGNISRASPAGDSPPPLLVLGARVNLRETSGTKSIPLEEFFRSPGRTIMKPSELFINLEIPNPPKESGTAFLKVARTGMDLAKVNAASMIMVEDNVVQSCRVALGGVAPTPIRVKKVEELLIGEKPTDARFADAAKTASDEVRPIASSHSHKRSTAQYRINVSGVLVKRTLQLARGRSLERK
jgi:CO/xanthine dehydrogenase FAD-binding subunit